MLGFGKRIISAFWLLWLPASKLKRHPPERFARTGGAVMLLGLAWGGLLAALWDLSFRLTWPALLNWVVPAVVCAAAMTLGPYRLAAASLLEAAIGRQASPASAPPWVRWVALGTLTALVALGLNYAVRWWDPDWPTHLPQSWAWLWPRALYRMLILAPVWGSWSMLGLVQFHRPGPVTDAPTRQFAASVGPLAAAGYLMGPLAGSLIYMNFLYPWHFLPAAAALAAGLGGGTALVRLRGGLCREAMLATNFLTQLLFLLAYLAAR